MEIKMYFNNHVNYLDGIFHKDLLTLFEQTTISYQSEDLVVIQVEGWTISLHDSGLVGMDRKDVEHVLPTIEHALTTYLRLHKYDKRFTFPYVFKCFVEQKDIGKVIHALEEVDVRYETREISDKVMIEIFQKATLY